MPDPWEFLVLPFLLSAGISLLVLLVFWRPWDAKVGRARWAAPVALAAGTMAPFRLITGATPSFPPSSAMGWFFYLPLVAAGVGMLMILFQMPRWMQLVVAVITCVAGFTFIFWNPLHDAVVFPTVVLLIMVASLVGGTWWWIIEFAATKFERGTAPLVMLLLALFSGAILMMSASATHGRLCIAFAGAAFSLAVIVLMSPRLRAEGCGLVLAMSVGGLLAAGNYYAELTWTNTALLFIAPAAMLLRVATPNARSDGPKSSIVCLTLVLIPLIVAAIITVHLFIASLRADESLYGY